MKQSALAGLVGCAASRVSQLEGGEPWSVDLALQFAAALGVGLSDLVDGESSALDVLLVDAVRTKNYRVLIQAAQAELQRQGKK